MQLPTNIHMSRSTKKQFIQFIRVYSERIKGHERERERERETERERERERDLELENFNTQR